MTRCLAVVLIGIASSLAMGGSGPDVASRRLGSAPPRAFERVEWEIDPGCAYRDPFDPDEVAIDATFQGPDGRRLRVPAFWDAQFDAIPWAKDKAPASRPVRHRWLVRFAPPTAGVWTMQVAIRDRAGTRTGSAASFEVAAPQSPGFVRRSLQSPQYLEFASGKPYFPIGLNLAWGAGGGNLEQYDRWFTALARAGGNFARIWQCSPGRMTETKESGAGRFDLAAMAYYDALLDLAQQRGICVMLTLMNYRDLRERDNWGQAVWPRFPYNAALGGPATRPADFFAHPEARRLYQRRLRYLVARYSAYQSLAFWEFFNEQEFLDSKMPPEWLAEMSAYLQRNDPYGRIVTTSSALPDEMWNLPSIDITQRHLYANGSDDLITRVLHSTRRHLGFAKPHLVAELGIDAKGSDEKFDKRGTGTSIHHGLWAAMMSGAAGGACHWYWDHYVEAHDLWKVYSGAAKFAATIDWPRRQFQPLQLAGPQAPLEGPETFQDVVIPCTLGWGRPSGEALVIQPNGEFTGELPRYLFGPGKPEFQGDVPIDVLLERESTMTLRIARVSEKSMIEVLIDGRPAAKFELRADPYVVEVKSVRQHSSGSYEAVYEVDRRVPIPAGSHRITLRNTAGDWAMLDTVTFTGAVSSRYGGLRAPALRDARTGETLVWIYDAKQTWKADQGDQSPRTFRGATIQIPWRGPAKATVCWWDTRQGNQIQRRVEAASSGLLRLMIPDFSRDIALRLLEE